jgi:hypothetical protein
VYGGLALLLPLRLTRMRGPRQVLHLSVIWSAYLAVVVVGSLAPPITSGRYGPGDALAGVDNAALPLATMLVVSMVLGFRAAAPERLLTVVAATLVVVMMMNAFVAYLQVGGFQIHAAWSAGEETTATRAATMGRYSGLINQPAEAGTLYSLATISAVYVLRSRPILLTLALAGLVTGGALTVSKIFLLAGLPVATWLLLTTRTGKLSRIAAAALVVLAGWASVSAGLLPAWSGADMIRRLVPDSSGNWVLVLTANRYGSDSEVSTLSTVVASVLEGPMWFGFGGHGLAIAYDSQWVEVLVAAGLVGLVLHMLLWLILARAWTFMAPSAERSLYLAVALVLAAGSLGLPVLTANRVATVTWVFLLLLLSASTPRKALRCRHIDRLEPASQAAPRPLHPEDLGIAPRVSPSSKEKQGHRSVMPEQSSVTGTQVFARIQ